MAKYLLILPCGKYKENVNNVRAVDLYTGPFYRVLRRRYDLQNKDLDILILSAKYGLLESNEIVSYYDQMMNKKRAAELQDQVYNKLKSYLADKSYEEIFINMGKIYELAINDESRELLNSFNTTWIKGEIGERCQQLKDWLIQLSNEQTKKIDSWYK